MNKLKFYTTHDSTYIYSCLLENNDIDESMKNHAIKVICNKCSIYTQKDFLIDSKRLNLTKYNISDLVISICDKCDNDYDIIIIAVAVEGLRRCDIKKLTSKISEINKPDVALKYAQNAKVLYEDDYSELLKIFMKNYIPLRVTHLFLGFFGEKLKQIDIENFIYYLCANKGVYDITYFINLDCIKSQMDYLVLVLCIKATSDELVDITIKYQSLLSYNINNIVCELCKKDDLKIENILNFVFNVHCIDEKSLEILKKRAIKFNILDENIKNDEVSDSLDRRIYELKQEISK